MNRRGETVTESEVEDDSAGMADSELTQVKRQLRIMEKDYRAYKEHTKNLIRKQTNELNVLEKEKQELDLDLSNSSDRKHTASDERQIGELGSLEQKVKEINNQIKEEQDSCKDLDSQISEMKAKIRQQRQTSAGANNTANKHQQTNKKKLVLEGRLDKKLNNFNKLLSQNKDMREEIDHLRREKSVFDDFYKQLSKKLESIKREMADVIEQATSAYDQRDDALNKMAALRERNEKDALNHDTEMKDLRRKIDHDDKIKEFMIIKSDDRAELKAEEAAKKEAMKDGKAINAELALIQEYEEAFARIKEVTGEENIDIIVENFTKAEAENFALFNYINEQNSEIEALNDQVAEIKTDMEEFNKQQVDDSENHQKTIGDIESRLHDTASEKEHHSKQLSVINKALDQLRSGIEAMFNKIGCDPKPIYDTLGGEEGISNKNVMTYLGLIEQKTSLLLTVMYYRQLKKAETEGVPPPNPPDSMAIPQTPKTMAIVPPEVGDDDYEEQNEEDEYTPMSEKELRVRVNKSIEKKQVALVQQAAKGSKDKRRSTGRQSPLSGKKASVIKN